MGKRSRYPLLVVFITAWLAGCQSNIERSRSYGVSAESALEQIVATDLVSILMQLPSHAPFYTTVQFSNPRSPIGKALVAAMTNSGYGVQMVTADQGQNFVSYRVGKMQSETGFSTEYRLEINDIRISRNYAFQAGRVYPTSEAYVYGADPVRVLINDDIFKQQGGSLVYPTGVSFVESDGTVKARQTRLVQVSDANARKIGERIQNNRFLIMAKAAIYTTDRMDGGNSSISQKQYEAHSQVILRFATDALALGMANKTAIQKIIKPFDKRTDIFTITGCSHGKSLLFDGTESLSLARSQRVMEELLGNRIQSSNIREEGCFATEFGELLPPRGVVLTLKRKRPQQI